MSVYLNNVYSTPIQNKNSVVTEKSTSPLSEIEQLNQEINALAAKMKVMQLSGKDQEAAALSGQMRVMLKSNKGGRKLGPDEVIKAKKMLGVIGSIAKSDKKLAEMGRSVPFHKTPVTSIERSSSDSVPVTFLKMKLDLNAGI